MSHLDLSSDDSGKFRHCELSGDESCPQPLSKPAARCELCTGVLDPKYHPAPSEAYITAGEVAYNAYRTAVGGVVTYGPAKGAPLPTWEEQRADPDKALVVHGWEASANAVIAAYDAHGVFTGKRADHGADVLYPKTPGV